VSCDAGKPVCNIVLFGHAQLSIFTLQLFPKRGCKKQSVRYQWQSCNADDEEYKDIPGATTDTYVVKATQYMNIRCVIKCKYSFDSVDRSATVKNDFTRAVRNVRSISIVARDENGQMVTPDTKGKITLIGAFSALEPADATYEWTIKNGEEEKTATGQVLTVELPSGQTSYYLNVKDKYGYQLKNRLYFPLAVVLLLWIVSSR
jgi:hypothetical protein